MKKIDSVKEFVEKIDSSKKVNRKICLPTRI